MKDFNAIIFLPLGFFLYILLWFGVFLCKGLFRCVVFSDHLQSAAVWPTGSEGTFTISSYQGFLNSSESFCVDFYHDISVIPLR